MPDNSCGGLAVRPETTFVDIHYHVGPDAYIRRHTARKAGKIYQSHQGWVVLKNHLGSCAAQAWEARQEGLPVSGSIVLNDISGGFDLRSIEQAVIQQGEDSGLRLLVHLPTVTGRAHRSKLRRTPAHSLLARGLRPLTVSDENLELRSDVRELFKAARDLPIVISTGHASAEEVRLLIDETTNHEGVRLLLNQPANPLTGLSYEALAQIVQVENVWTEQTALTFLLGYQGWEDFAAVLAKIPRAVYSSDLGQPNQPDIGEWLSTSRNWFSRAQLTPQRIAGLTFTEPLNMLTG